MLTFLQLSLPGYRPDLHFHIIKCNGCISLFPSLPGPDNLFQNSRREIRIIRAHRVNDGTGTDCIFVLLILWPRDECGIHVVILSSRFSRLISLHLHAFISPLTHQLPIISLDLTCSTSWESQRVLKHLDSPKPKWKKQSPTRRWST